MARAATTADVFNAVAESRRREILSLLAQGEMAVGDLVDSLPLPQPLVSKHLRVLREVGLVSARDAGRQRLYRVNGQALKPLHDWVSGFRALWEERFDAMDQVLAAMTDGEPAKENGDGDDQ
jgi:DNA-binding transcriptional ArsR family regulator